MILSQVREYIRERGNATLSDVALHFDAEPEAVRGMLEIWINKGKIHRQSATENCGSSCNSCDSAAIEIYSWGAPAPITVEFLPGHCNHQKS